MAKKYLRHLPPEDPLYHYLQHDILPQLGVASPHADYRVYKMGGTHDVYLYEDKHSGNRLVGKFFSTEHEHDTTRATRRAKQELNNLNTLRSYGLMAPPHTVVRPLGYNLWLNNLLVLEYRAGDSLSKVINAAIYRGGRDRLFRKLTALAYFLATLHNRTANGLGVDFNEDCHYMDRLVAKLLEKQTINRDEADELYWLRDRWREQPHLWEDQQVLVHGDATPSNFLFGSGLDVCAVDLERMKRADRVFDVGRLAGELQHFFLQATGNKYAAEPFIGHFLWEYACHFPDREEAFRSIGGRVPFYMGLTLLRIARNSWVNSEYRRRLVEEAKITLRTF